MNKSRLKIFFLFFMITLMRANSFAQCDSVNTIINDKVKFLGSWQSNGTPEYLEPEKDTVSNQILNFINSILPESANITNSGYFSEDAKPNTELIDSANVYLTFVHEGASWKNTLGYYTYDLDNPPTSYEEIDSLVIVFPNVDSVNVIKPGDKVHLGLFPPNTGIGYFLITRGWNGDSICIKDKIVFTDKELNTFTTPQNRQHTIMLNYEEEQKFLLGIEDQPRPSGDKDFNDAVFYVSADKYEAIDSTDVPKIPLAEITGDTVLCSEDDLATVTIKLSGNPPFSFTYNNGSEDIEVTDVNDTIYTFETAVKDTLTLVSVYDKDGMGIVKGSAILQTSQLEAGFVTNTITTCEESEVEAKIYFKGFPPYTLTYEEDGEEVIVESIAEDTISILFDGDSEFILTNVEDKYCSVSLDEELSITNFDKPTATLESADTTICENTTFEAEVVFTGTAPFTFVYELNSVENTIVSDENTYSFEVNETSEILPVSISDANCSGGTTSGSVSVDFNDAPEVEITTPEIQCGIDGEAEIVLDFSGNGPFDCEYEHEGSIISGSTTSTLAVELDVNEGFKLLSFSDTNCDGIVPDSISSFYNYSIPTAEIIGEDIINCGNESSIINIEFKGKGPFTAVISNGTVQETINTNESEYEFTTDEEGTFELLSVENENCEGTVSGEITVSKSDVPTVQLTAPVISCDAEEDAVITLTFDGTSPYSFEYEISGESFSGSSDDEEVEINVPLGSSFELISFQDSNCEGDLAPEEIVFNNYTSPVATLVTQNAYICDGSSAELVINLTGLGPYTFIISDGANNETVTTSDNKYIYSTDQAGTYSLISVENATCVGTVSGEALVEEKENPEYTVDASNNTICGTGEAEILIEFTGIAPFNFDLIHRGETTSYISDENTYSLFLSDEGTYQVTNVSDAFCQSTEEEIFEIIQFDAPEINMTGPNFICENELTNIQLELSGVAPFSFTISDGTSVETITTYEISYTYEVSEAGTYTITEFGDANCSGDVDGLTIDIEEKPKPDMVISHDEVICENESAIVTFNFTGESPWSFTLVKDGTEQSYTSTDSEFEVTLDEAGTYQIIDFTDAYCDKIITEEIEIIERASPVAEISGGGEICGEGEEATIAFSFVGEAPFTFIYTDGEEETEVTTDQSTYSFNTIESGVYELVSVTDQFCSGEVSGIAEVKNLLDDIDGEILGDDTSCEGEEINLTLSLTEDVENVEWSTTGAGNITVNSLTEISYTPAEDETGEVSFTASIDTDCGEKSFTKSVTVIPIPSSNFTVSPEELFTSEDIVFIADGDASVNYSWDLGDGTSLNGDQVNHSYDEPGEYEIILSAETDGCSSETIEVITVKSLNELYVPNVFNPEALNAENQVVKVYGTNVSEENFSFKIVNRWGNVMYQTNSFFEANSQGWDGREYNNGEMQSLSTFSYILVGSFKNGEAFERTGTITILQ